MDFIELWSILSTPLPRCVSVIFSFFCFIRFFLLPNTECRHVKQQMKWQQSRASRVGREYQSTSKTPTELVEPIDLPEKVSQQTCSKSFVWPAVCHLPDLSITPSGLGSKSDILCCILSKMWTKFDMFLEMFSDEREFSDGFCWDSWRRADGIFRLRTSFWADTSLCPTVSKEVQSVGVQKLRS